MINLMFLALTQMYKFIVISIIVMLDNYRGEYTCGYTEYSQNVDKNFTFEYLFIYIYKFFN